MNFDIRAFGFAICISFSMMLVFMGNILIVSGIFGIEFILKELLAGIILLFIGLFSLILTINVSLNTSKEKQ